jgi:hypothetical protein
MQNRRGFTSDELWCFAPHDGEDSKAEVIKPLVVAEKHGYPSFSASSYDCEWLLYGATKVAKGSELGASGMMLVA